ncbi:hypothetical protein M409DRAFT_64430 [Zasmidium cellare ATCC 36951]|uniref:ATP-dependent RNA helicase n=1 Tax=Zasmidium cellare ATCC 36951 TaxID=1080233 RepID=A0A6A6CXH3_ZASCE|nr:uncharacterized protein M409DRAFT_64430 [Zasmidium cellare ATCC 36951]KAF2170056.1 hypothetical protein M409DRAFT_64430 [Zasmidium cellare ATCC 36951]
MRRAFQTCSRSIPRSITSLTTSRAAQQCLRSSPTTHNAASRAPLAIRSLHQTTKLRQQAATQEAESSAASGNATITKFEELEQKGIVHPNVVRTLTKEMGLETMTEVQTATINSALKGTDIIAQARTGTGKTLAFLLPILQRIIDVDPSLANRTGGRRGPRTTADDIRGLIISPTRELAEQIATEARRLTKNTGVIVQTAVGGTQKSAGLRAIQRDGCHLLVGTPGRLKDILNDPYSRVEAPDLSALVFDEADRLLDQGFWPEIQEIMHRLPTSAEKDRQTLMFSATVPAEVVDLVRQTLKPGFQFVKCVRDDESPTHERVPQKVVRLNGFENALPSLIELCTRSVEEAKSGASRPFKAIVYFPSTAEVSLASMALENLADPNAERDAFGGGSGRSHPLNPARIFEIHGKLTQAQRTQSSNSFRNCESGILLSSDVTARGMDFPNVTHVIQVGLPSSREQYIHRIGRTARAGKEGEGWIILNPFETSEARGRLRGLPLQKDESLSIPSLDLTRAADVPAQAGKILGMYQRAIQRVPMGEKAKVYLAQLGVHQFVSRKEQLIQAMNNLSQFGWGLREPPSISPALASRLGLRNLPGVRIGDDRPPMDRGRMGDRMDRDGAFGGRSSGGRGGFGGRNDFGGRGGGGGGYGNDRPSYRGGGRDRFGGPRAINDDPFS